MDMKMNSTLTKLRRLILIGYNVCKGRSRCGVCCRAVTSFYTQQRHTSGGIAANVSYTHQERIEGHSHTHTQKNWWFKPAMHEECRFFPFYKNTKSIPRILKIQGLYIYTPIRHEVAGFFLQYTISI